VRECNAPDTDPLRGAPFARAYAALTGVTATKRRKSFEIVFTLAPVSTAVEVATLRMSHSRNISGFRRSGSMSNSVKRFMQPA
jgi:hypothetical protein